jgi:hypothetical protein
MDIIRPYKSNKNMTETERIEHLKQLNRARRNRAYRKKKMEQLKIKQQQEPKITIQKIDWCNNCIDEEDKEDKEDEEFLVYLLENVKFDNSEEDNEILEAIDILEDKLNIDEEEKLNAYVSSDSSYSSDSN